LFNVITPEAEATLFPGVNLAVQIDPLCDDVGLVREPFATVRSAAENAVIGSLKVNVTVAMSPIFRAVSDIAIVAVGRRVSIRKLGEVVCPNPLLPATSV
jgi:hypothetical protein